ncbi:ABC transporter permease [Mycolicibacterium arenosum]|uniref:Iron ABC transporter permease n=1 Tax=Mycolicibacterium arenosum TaxID=2952157 RepID=A0ABT1MAU4_9MYCO|nr:iron ABC transporter permease [Mycolicibacterium sp. CAU 1645]MCP9276296.1 iron ABC transporter permease [Mycolicibacterium sp. CAU 1645]
MVTADHPLTAAPDVAPTGPRPGPALRAGVLVLVAATFIPLGYIAWSMISLGPGPVYQLLARPRVGELLVNTVGLVVVTVPLCLILGVATAWLVERTDVPGRAVWRPLFVAPLAVPAFINSYAWVSVVPTLHGFWAGVLVATMSYFPFAYVPVAATLRRLDPAIEESARALGSSPATAFRRIVLPQLRLAILGGGLLIGVHLLAEYGAFAMLRFSTFTTAIFEQFQATFNGAAGSTLAGVLVLLCLVLILGETAARGNARYARIGSGAQRISTPQQLGSLGIPASIGLALLAALALGVPVWIIARWLWIGGIAAWTSTDIVTSTWQTVVLAAAAAALTTVLAFPFAWVAVRYSGFFARFVEGSNFVTSSMPGIVTALALVIVAIRYVPPLYQTVALVLAAYVLLFLPRAMVNLRSGLAQVPPGLEEASRSLGVSPSRTFLRVTLRLTAPAAAAGASLVFVAVATELTATLLLAPTGTNTLAMRFWSLSSELDYPGAAPYAFLLVALSVPVTVVLFRQSTKVAAL